MLDRDTLIFLLAIFLFVALGSREIGRTFKRLRLPLITGFLFAGIIAGPFVLGLIPPGATQKLRFIDEISLGYIAFAAGTELYLKELRGRMRSIGWVTAMLVISTFVFGSIAMYLIAPLVPFMRELTQAGRIGVSLLAGSILVARSPSSAIAIVNELRAKGPLTRTVLGVTMVGDVVVVILFAISVSAADALLHDAGFDVSFVLLLAPELVLSLVIATVVSYILRAILSLQFGRWFKTAAILLCGYGVFLLSAWIRHESFEVLPIDILVEPLLICMIAGFLVTNYSAHRMEFGTILEGSAAPIYVAFFTLTGASLALDVLAETWQIALMLVLIRVGLLIVGAVSGGLIAGDPHRMTRVSWMTYITQAGVGLGLAKEVAVEFDQWGTDFATLIIASIVINQVIGPPLFKWAIQHVGEAHTRASGAKPDGPRDTLILGLNRLSTALARQLQSEGWNVRIAATAEEAAQFSETEGAEEIEIVTLSEITPESLRMIGAKKDETIVGLLGSDQENLYAFEIAFEHFGTEHLVVRLEDRAFGERFQDLGAFFVHPGSAMVNLLDQVVRSPATASLVLGIDERQDFIDIEMNNRDLHGVSLRDISLPLDCLVLSIRRGDQMIVSHGFTQLERGDWITVVGTPDGLETVMRYFDANY